MEFLFEIVFEIVFEIAFEGLFALGSTAFIKLSDKCIEDTKSRQWVKWTIGTLLLLATIGVIVYGLVKKRGAIVTASLIYLLATTILIALSFYNKRWKKRFLAASIFWVSHILHYGFATALFVLSIIFVDGPVAKYVIVIGAVIAIIVFISIDVHKGRVRNKQKENPLPEIVQIEDEEKAE